MALHGKVKQMKRIQVGLRARARVYLHAKCSKREFNNARAAILRLLQEGFGRLGFGVWGLSFGVRILFTQMCSAIRHRRCI
jgi:hypothetical protein